MKIEIINITLFQKIKKNKPHNILNNFNKSKLGDKI